MKLKPVSEMGTPMKKRIHINQHNIRHNLKHSDYKPVVTVKTYKENIKCMGVKILGECEVIYSPDKPLSCGAKVWLETNAPIEIIEKLPI